MRHASSSSSSNNRGAGSYRMFHEKTRWSNPASSNGREKNPTRTGYGQGGSDRDDFRSFYPKRGQGSFKGIYVEKKEETEKPFGNRNYHKPIPVTSRDHYKMIATSHVKKASSPHVVKVWVHNLPPSYSEDDIHNAFESSGSSFSLVVWCQFYPGSPASRKETLSAAKKGFAYLAFQSLENALEFEREYSGLKLKDSNSGLEYGVKIFRALFPKVPSKYRYRDPLVDTIFDDADFIDFQRALNNGTQEEEEQSKGNSNISTATNDAISPEFNPSNAQVQDNNDKEQLGNPSDTIALDKSADSFESDSNYSSGRRNKSRGYVTAKPRYAKPSVLNTSSSRSHWIPRYRVKKDTEQDQE